ncbi:hypothetical protein GBAR_LOCUS9044 [Geodia barretti]|uniref:Uncharacterized protein n=1 Tax=Geodia barretti TaxID=519541 RepID=A0AA35RNV3_GEOBA|nr:hypothetical protein GBAR_LOCUS9044 [Geodia barretti]
MDPSPTAAENGAEDSWSGVPIAAVLCICLVVFLAVVVCLLCVRKLLQRRGVSVTCVSCACCEGRSRGCGGCGGCGGEACVSVAERLDCQTPDIKACLDRVCPSQQVCSMWCGRVWSCYSCHMIRDRCQVMSCAGLCPACTACECPDVQCCGRCCHCKLKTPDCTHINCLFCDLDCGGGDNDGDT